MTACRCAGGGGGTAARLYLSLREAVLSAETARAFLGAGAARGAELEEAGLSLAGCGAAEAAEVDAACGRMPEERGAVEHRDMLFL